MHVTPWRILRDVIYSITTKDYSWGNVINMGEE